MMRGMMNDMLRVMTHLCEALAALWFVYAVLYTAGFVD